MGPPEMTLSSKRSKESNLITSNEQVTTHAMTTFDNRITNLDTELCKFKHDFKENAVTSGTEQTSI